MKTCPNCGELVGDKVKSCFNCKYSFLFGRYIPEGEELNQHDIAYAISETIDSIEEANKNPVYYEICRLMDWYKDDEAAKLIQKCFNCDEETAKEAIDLNRKSYDEWVRKRGGTPLSKEADLRKMALNNAEWRVAQQNEPKCPTCGGTLVKRLSVVNRGASVAILGVYSNKFNKSFECKNCGYTW